MSWHCCFRSAGRRMASFLLFTSMKSEPVCLKARASRGFTLIELVVVIVVLGILAAIAIIRFAPISSDARTASIKALGGAVNEALGIVKSATAIRGVGTAGTQTGITWFQLDATTPVRIWNGYPDRWCDGIGVAIQGNTVPSGGCYLSSSAISQGTFTFYGYGNGSIPGGDAGWRIESAPDPANCSVRYNYGGSGMPAVTIYTSGC